MPNKTQITEAQQLQIAAAILMIAFKLLGLPENLEYAGYGATVIIAAFTWFRRSQDKKRSYLDSIDEEREIIKKLMNDLVEENSSLHKQIRELKGDV